MSIEIPIPRELRRRTIEAEEGQTEFGPFDFPIFDVLDVAVLVSLNDGVSFGLLDEADYTVTPVGELPGYFTVTLEEGRDEGDLVRVEGRRVPQRLTNVTQGGIIRSQELEREFDRTAVTLQEVRRDMNIATGGLDQIAAGILAAEEAAQEAEEAAESINSYEGAHSIEREELAFRLVGDEDSPGYHKVYGTDGNGARGFQSKPLFKAASNTAMQAILGLAAGDLVYLNEAGREGMWAKSTADQSSLMVDRTGTTTAIDASTNRATLEHHGLRTGDSILVTATSDLTAGTIYYANYIDDDTFEVCSSYANAMAGTEIDLTVTTNFSFQKLVDPLGGLFVPLKTATADDLAGVNGAYVRLFQGSMNLDWFPGDPEDDRRKFMAAFDYARVMGGGRLIVPARTYTFNSYGNTYPGQVLNRPCLSIDGMRDFHVEAHGATFEFGSDISDTGYLFLAVVTSEWAAAEGAYTRRVSWKGGRIVKSRGGSFTNTLGSINTCSAEDVLYEEIEQVADDATYTHTAWSGTNNRRVQVVRCRTKGINQPFDISLWSRLKVLDGDFDRGGAAANGTCIPHFYDSVTASTNYLEFPEAEDIADGIEIAGNLIRGFPGGVALSAVRNAWVHHNEIIGTAQNNAGLPVGIQVYTDDELDGAGLFTEGVIVSENIVSGFTNAGAGTGQGIRIPTGTGTKSLQAIQVFDNQIFDNDYGILLESGITDLDLSGGNDFSRDSGSQQNLVSKTNYRGAWDGYVTLTDDTAIGIDAPNASGYVRLIAEGFIVRCAEWYYNVSAGSNGPSLVGSGAGLVTGALAGTTSSDARVTYSSANDGKIYIENRTGVSVTFYYQFSRMPAD